MARLGITPHALALAVTVMSYQAILLVCAVAGVLHWRRSDDWMALLVALTLILMPSLFTPIMQGLPNSWQWVGSTYNVVTLIKSHRCLTSKSCRCCSPFGARCHVRWLYSCRYVRFCVRSTMSDSSPVAAATAAGLWLPRRIHAIPTARSAPMVGPTR